MKSQKKAYPTSVLCSALGVSQSGYYAWAKSMPNKRTTETQRLIPIVREIQKKHKSSCGSRRMSEQFAKAGESVGRCKAARLMREAKSPFIPARKFRITTDSKHNFAVSPNLLKRDFCASKPNQVWVSDISYLWSDDGWSYLAVVIDLFNREIVGMSIKNRMDRSLVMDALKSAVWNKQPSPGLIFHSDRGSQYCCNEFRSLLEFYGMKSSMSRKGDCWDNAVSESFFATLKKERTMRNAYRNRSELYTDVFEYVYMFYNSYRGHSYLGYKSPMEFASITNCRMVA